MKIALYFLLTCSAAWAQMPGNAATPRPMPARSSTAVPLDSQATDLLNQIRSSAERLNADVARLHVDKWKTDAASKQQAQAGAASISRNLNNAMPDLLQRTEASPGSLSANFRLYRNMNALYDTFSALVESAGAFGPREQYDPLAADVSQLDQLRHQVAERVDRLAGENDAELARLRTRAAAAPAPPRPPAKVVVDDEQPKPKKKAKPKPKTTGSQKPPQPTPDK
jgi:hypothetical protein